MSWSCDWDGPSVYDESEVVARKEYRCVECSAPILMGEKHLSYRGMWDGGWDGGRQHLLCRDACVWIRDQLQGECIAFGELSEWWDNCRSPYDVVPWQVRHKKDFNWEREVKRWTERWKVGARMYAMVRRRERLAREGA